MSDEISRLNEDMPLSPYIDDEYTARYRNDAERGDPEAQHALAIACLTNFDSEGEAANVAEALRWMRKAAEQNHADSLYTLGLWCELGRFIPKNDDAAVALGCKSRRAEAKRLGITHDAYCKRLQRKTDSFKTVLKDAGYQ